MKDYIKNRVLTEAEYTIEHNSTVRATANALNSSEDKTYHVSKSMVHSDLTKRLPYIDPFLHKQVLTILETNKSERAYRGGMATKRKYLLMKENI